MAISLEPVLRTTEFADDIDRLRNANYTIIENGINENTALKADKSTTYTKSENDALLSAKETVVNIDTLKGTGWTNESVKGNADEVAIINSRKLDTAITITVGTGGDYATINEALAYATTRYPVYVSASVKPRMTISLLAGFVMAEQVIVDGQDLSWITISSIDAEVVITRSALTTLNADNVYPAFTAQNGAALPIISVLFNMDTSGTATNRVGIHCIHNSIAYITSGKGVKNAGSHGIWAHKCSTIDAQSAIITGAGSFGIYASHGSTINARSADASGASTYGIFAEMSSTINAQSANAQMGTSPATTDFRVSLAGLINTVGGIGGVSQVAHTVTSSGIIFG